MIITESYNNFSHEQLAVVNARYLGDFVVRVRFNDNTEKAVDFKPFLKNSHHPSIKKYLDESRFKTFKIKDGNLDWNDFDLCFPIFDLYQNSILKDVSQSTLETNF